MPEALSNKAKETIKSRRGLCRAASEAAQQATLPALQKRGLAGMRLLTEWNSIVGEPLCYYSMPERIRLPKGQRGNGTLILRVASGWALELQYLTPQIIERISTYFGYPAVQQIKCIQDPSFYRKMPEAKPQKIHSEATLARIESTLPNDLPDALRTALTQLGASIHQTRDHLSHRPKGESG